MKTSLFPALTLLALTIPVAVAQAQQFTVPATTVPGVNHTYNSQFSFGMDALVGMGAQVSGPDFTANLAAVNTLSWTISAPAGFQFVLQRPAGVTNAELNFAGGWSGSPSARSAAFYTGLPVFLTLANGTGSFTSDNLSFALSGLADQFGFGGAMGVSTTPITFTALTLVADISSITDRTGWGQQTYLGNAATGFGPAGLRGRSFVPSGSADPGSLVTLAPIPEPSTTAALLAGAAALAAGGVRRVVRRRGLDGAGVGAAG